MTRREIAEYRQTLRNILAEADDKTRMAKLKDLAKKVGAGYVHTEIAGITKTETKTPTSQETTHGIYHNTISESELVLNINNALQTETMIDTCKIANRSWIVAIISAIVSIISIVIALKDNDLSKNLFQMLKTWCFEIMNRL
jgi:hypothetical protein